MKGLFIEWPRIRDFLIAQMWKCMINPTSTQTGCHQPKHNDILVLAFQYVMKHERPARIAVVSVAVTSFERVVAANLPFGGYNCTLSRVG